jgi:hypothetical protein
VIGRYILTPAIFRYLDETKPGRGGEIQLTDALRKMAQDYPLYAYLFEGKRYDAGNKLGFLQATVEFALATPNSARPRLPRLIRARGGYKRHGRGDRSGLPRAGRGLAAAARGHRPGTGDRRDGFPAIDVFETPGERRHRGRAAGSSGRAAVR